MLVRIVRPLISEHIVPTNPAWARLSSLVDPVLCEGASKEITREPAEEIAEGWERSCPHPLGSETQPLLRPVFAPRSDVQSPEGSRPERRSAMALLALPTQAAGCSPVTLR